MLTDSKTLTKDIASARRGQILGIQSAKILTSGIQTGTLATNEVKFTLTALLVLGREEKDQIQTQHLSIWLFHSTNG